CARASTGFDYW
nr:immunoglobulin heavy chain junction region [Macaca mulatta]MOX01430.1 immunoglobulin heavy chain junction region [Macaca mulatta]MOX03270.1 immunoglobulin heavy chain junction region [Macaca mulatta]